MHKSGGSAFNRNMDYDTNNKRTQNIFPKSYEPFNREDTSTQIHIKPNKIMGQLPYYDQKHEKLTKSPS